MAFDAIRDKAFQGMGLFPLTEDILQQFEGIKPERKGQAALLHTLRVYVAYVQLPGDKQPDWRQFGNIYLHNIERATRRLKPTPTSQANLSYFYISSFLRVPSFEDSCPPQEFVGDRRLCWIMKDPDGGDWREYRANPVIQRTFNAVRTVGQQDQNFLKDLLLELLRTEERSVPREDWETAVKSCRGEEHLVMMLSIILCPYNSAANFAKENFSSRDWNQYKTERNFKMNLDKTVLSCVYGSLSLLHTMAYSEQIEKWMRSMHLDFHAYFNFIAMLNSFAVKKNHRSLSEKTMVIYHRLSAAYMFLRQTNWDLSLLASVNTLQRLLKPNEELEGADLRFFRQVPDIQTDPMFDEISHGMTGLNQVLYARKMDDLNGDVTYSLDYIQVDQEEWSNEMRENFEALVRTGGHEDMDKMDDFIQTADFKSLEAVFM